MNTTAPQVPSWKNPKPLRNALTTWACRDDTRDDPKALSAAADALAAIDDTIAGLVALRARVEREMTLGETAGNEPCPADWGSATVSQRCILPRDHAGQHIDSAGGIFGVFPWQRTAVPADDDSGYHEAAELDHDERIAVALAADGPLTGPQLAVVHPAADAERPVAHSVTRCQHGYYSCPLCDEIPIRRALQDDEDFSDEELAGLPPMFPRAPGAAGSQVYPNPVR